MVKRKEESLEFSCHEKIASEIAVECREKLGKKEVFFLADMTRLYMGKLMGNKRTSLEDSKKVLIYNPV